MEPRKALHRLTESYPLEVLADRLQRSTRWVTMVKNDNAVMSPDEEWRVREELEKLQGEHVAAHELGIYAIQMVGQIRRANTKDEVDDFLDDVVPALEKKVQGLMVQKDDLAP